MKMRFFLIFFPFFTSFHGTNMTLQKEKDLIPFMKVSQAKLEEALHATLWFEKKFSTNMHLFFAHRPLDFRAIEKLCRFIDLAFIHPLLPNFKGDITEVLPTKIEEIEKEHTYLESAFTVGCYLTNGIHDSEVKKTVGMLHITYFLGQFFFAKARLQADTLCLASLGRETQLCNPLPFSYLKSILGISVSALLLKLNQKKRSLLETSDLLQSAIIYSKDFKPSWITQLYSMWFIGRCFYIFGKYNHSVLPEKCFTVAQKNLKARSEILGYFIEEFEGNKNAQIAKILKDLDYPNDLITLILSFLNTFSYHFQKNKEKIKEELNKNYLTVAKHKNGFLKRDPIRFPTSITFFLFQKFLYLSFFYTICTLLFSSWQAFWGACFP